MGTQQVLGLEAERQNAGAGDLEAIIEDPDAHRTADGRVIPMAEGVRESFTKRGRRVEWVIDSLEEVRDHAPGHRKVITHEALRSLKKRESVSDLLAIINELALVRASESRKTEQALRVLRKKAFGTAEQDDGCIQRATISKQAETLEQGNWISRLRIIHALPPHRLINRSNDLGGIQVGNRDVRCGLQFPWALWMHSLEESALIHLAGHRYRFRALADVRPAVVRVRSVAHRDDRHDEHLATAFHRDALELKQNAWLDLPEFGEELFDGGRGHILAPNLAAVGHPEDDVAAPAVQHTASSFCSLGALTGALLELDLVRLAGCYQSFELSLDHARITTREVLMLAPPATAC